MAGRHRVKDGRTKRYMWGTAVVQSVIVYRGFVVPWLSALYLPPHEADRWGRSFRTQVDLAAEMVEGFRPPEGLRVVVLFDAFYANKKVIGAVVRCGWTYVTRVASNRRVYLRGGRGSAAKRTVGSYMRNVLGRDSNWLKQGKGQTQKRFRVAVRNAALNGIPGVRFVFSEMHRRGRRRYKKATPIALITNALQMPPLEVIRLYQKRWPIEIFFSEVKQRHGWGDYQTRSLEGAGHHLALVNTAHALLTHLQLVQFEGAQANKHRVHPGASSRLWIQNWGRELLWRDLMELVDCRGLDWLHLEPIPFIDEFSDQEAA